MKRLVCCLLGALITLGVFSQKTIKGQILDQVTSQSIPFANVGIIDTSIGDIADQHGNFIITIPDSLTARDLTFHTPGYQLMSLPVANFNDTLFTIYLGANVIQLQEVVVQKKGPKIQTEDMGVKEKLAQYLSMTLSQTSSGGGAVASRYSVDADGFWLDEVRIKINRNLSDSVKLRIRLLSRLASGLPGHDLISTDLIRTSVGKEGWLTFNLENKYIYVHASEFFICYELLENVATRKEMEQRSEQKSRMMYDLYDKGVKGIQIRVDSLGNRIGWSSSLSRKAAETYGVGFPTGNTYFSVASSKKNETYIRKSSFDAWKPLYGGGFSLVSSLKVSYHPNKSKTQTTPKTQSVQTSFPLIWGPHRVGFKSTLTYDSLRYYEAKTYEDGNGVPINTLRPVQMNIWYPSGSNSENVTLQMYAQTLASVERAVTLTPRVEEELVNAFTTFGFPEDYLIRPSTAQFESEIMEGTFPLVMYIPGLSGDAIENYKLCEFLASHGLIVLSIPSLGRSSREMEMTSEEIRTQIEDIDHAIRWAQSTLPLSDQIGIIGYSWGAMAGLAYSLESQSQIGLFISLDGSIYSYADMLNDIIEENTLDETRLTMISTRKLDRNQFALYNLLQGEKEFYQAIDMNHDDFISMAIDIQDGNKREVALRYSYLCHFIIDKIRQRFSGTPEKPTNSNLIRKWD